MGNPQSKSDGGVTHDRRGYARDGPYPPGTAHARYGGAASNGLNSRPASRGSSNTGNAIRGSGSARGGGSVSGAMAHAHCLDLTSLDVREESAALQNADVAVAVRTRASFTIDSTSRDSSSLPMAKSTPEPLPPMVGIDPWKSGSSGGSADSGGRGAADESQGGAGGGSAYPGSTAHFERGIGKGMEGIDDEDRKSVV